MGYLTGVLVFLVTMVSSIGFSHQLNFNRVIVFGDSLSDASIASSLCKDQLGNNYWIQAQVRHGAPITNKNKKNLSPLWVNDLVAKLARNGRIEAGELLWPVRLLHSSINKNQQEKDVNVSYAYAGSTTGFGFSNDRADTSFPADVSAECQQPGLFNGVSCVPGQLQQMTYFFRAHPVVDPSNLYILWAGSNDFFFNLQKVSSIAKQNNQWQWVSFFIMVQQNLSTQMRSQPIDGLYYYRPIANTIEAVRLLHQHGVNRNHIIVLGLPDMTLTPYLRSSLRNHSGLRRVLQIMSRLYNWQLRRHVSKYASFYSVYTLLDDINSEKNQFIYRSVSCVEKKKLPLCQGFVFYDHKHITVAAGQVLANRVYGFLK